MEPEAPILNSISVIGNDLPPPRSNRSHYARPDAIEEEEEELPPRPPTPPPNNEDYYEEYVEDPTRPSDRARAIPHQGSTRAHRPSPPSDRSFEDVYQQENYPRAAAEDSYESYEDPARPLPSRSPFYHEARADTAPPQDYAEPARPSDRARAPPHQPSMRAHRPSPPYRNEEIQQQEEPAHHSRRYDERPVPHQARTVNTASARSPRTSTRTTTTETIKPDGSRVVRKEWINPETGRKEVEERIYPPERMPVAPERGHPSSRNVPAQQFQQPYEHSAKPQQPLAGPLFEGPERTNWITPPPNCFDTCCLIYTTCQGADDFNKVAAHVGSNDHIECSELYAFRLCNFCGYSCNMRSRVQSLKTQYANKHGLRHQPDDCCILCIAPEMVTRQIIQEHATHFPGVPMERS